jgi:hypothetical protein
LPLPLPTTLYTSHLDSVIIGNTKYNELESGVGVGVGVGFVDIMDKQGILTEYVIVAVVVSEEVPNI